MCSILLVDDQTLFRKMLGSYLTQLPEKYVLFEAEHGQEAIDFLKEETVDLVILDMQMPGLSGIDTFKKIRQHNPDLKVLALTQLEDYSLIIHLIQQGINGFLLKSVDLEELTIAIKDILLYGKYMSELANKALMKYNDSSDQFSSLSLSPREMQLLELIVDGKSNKEIAAMLDLEILTVESYRKTLMKKIKCKNSADVVSFAYKVGLTK